MKARRIVAMIIGSTMASFVACTNDRAARQQVAPLYEIFYDGSRQERYSLADTLVPYAEEVAAMMKVLGYDSVSDEVLMEWSRSRVVEMFTPAIDSLAPTLDDVERSLGHILYSAMRHGLDIRHWRYAAVAWGNPKSIVFCDSVMLICMNHYLGDDFPGYAGLPDYLKAVKTPRMLPYDMAEALVATAYPYVADKGGNVLTRLLYEGALASAKMRLVEDASLADVLGYDSSQLSWAESHEADIWNRIVATKMLFDVSATTAERLVSPSPVCMLISPDAPGRVGRYVGYRIVESYMKHHPQVTLAELLSPDFYMSGSVLSDAAYAPLTGH